MGKILLAILILTAGVTALMRPWVGICSYYLLAILGPQYIWWWIFDSLRVSLIVAVCALMGVAFQVLKKNYNYDFLLNRQSFWLVVLWVSIVSSYFFGS